MEQQLLELFNKHGIVDYTFICIFIGVILQIIHDLICQLSAFLYEKAMYYRDKRKEMK